MTAPVLASYQTGSQGSPSGTGITCNVPSGVANGHLLVAVVYGRGDVGTTQSGWTYIDGVTSSNNHHRIFWRVAASEPPDYTFAYSAGSGRGCMFIGRVTGADPSDPVDAADVIAQGSASTADLPGITTGVAETLLLRGYSTADSDGGKPASTTVTGLTYVDFAQGASSTVGTLIELWQDDQPAAGASGTANAGAFVDALDHTSNGFIVALARVPPVNTTPSRTDPVGVKDLVTRRQHRKVRATSTVSNAGVWADQAAGTSNLHAPIDEATASDADYITSPAGPADAQCVVQLANTLANPSASSAHFVRYRIRSQGTGSVRLDIDLMNGSDSSVIASYQEDAPTTTWTTSTQTLGVAQVGVILDYTNLRLRFRATTLEAGTTQAQVSWAEVEAPAPGTVTLFQRSLTENVEVADQDSDPFFGLGNDEPDPVGVSDSISWSINSRPTYYSLAINP